MLNLIAAAWLKLTRRPLTWILLAIFLALMALQFVQLVISISLGAALLRPEQVADMWRRLVFPGVFGASFGHINGLGGIFAVILTAGAVGSEYGWGTLRTHLARHPDRTAYLLAHVIVLLMLLVVAMLATLVVSALLSLGLGALFGQVRWPALTAVVALPLALLRALYVLLPYVLLTLACTVYGRSVLAGIAGGMAYQIVDVALGAIVTFARLGGIWRAAYNVIIQANVSALTYLNSRAFGLRPEALNPSFDPALLPSPWQATVVIGLYSAVFLAIAAYGLHQHDITGAG